MAKHFMDMTDEEIIEELRKLQEPDTTYNYTYVDSSNVEAIAYDRESRQLYISFLSGREYVYFEVPGNTYWFFLNTGSPGSFVHRVMNNYDFVRIS